MSTATQPAARRRDWRKLFLIAVVIVLLALLLPPLVNLGHFDRKISSSISISLGRPVHLDHAGIRLLPTPALTLENFVVSESPDFGNEPVVRASSVTATLRVSSLWRRRIEISSISLDEPSINLTRNSRGDWNFKGILMQAASIPTSPTDPAAPAAPARPRFPYIEATHARVNFILNNEKIPFNLNDSDLALWQDSDGKWHLRVRTTPSRTDLALNDTGTLRADGEIGYAANAPRSSGWSSLPVDLQFRWEDVPLNQLARLFTGAGQDLRGYLQARASVVGTLGSAHVHTDLGLENLRGGDVVPDNTLTLAIACDADQAASLQRLDHLLCTLPLGNGSVSLAGSVADLRNLDPAQLFSPASAQPDLTLAGTHLNAAALLNLVRHFTAHIPDSVSIAGPVAASFTYRAAAKPHSKTPELHSPYLRYLWSGSLRGENLTLTLPPTGPPSALPSLFSSGNANTVTLRTVTLSTDTPKSRAALPGAPATEFSLAPVSLPLGGAAPASFSAKFSPDGFSLTLTGAATPQKLHAFLLAVPWLTPEDANSAAVPNSKESAAPAAPEHVDITIQQPWPQQ